MTKIVNIFHIFEYKALNLSSCEYMIYEYYHNRICEFNEYKG